METKDKINEILTKQFDITHLEVIDDSAKHAGHAGAMESGGGHFFVTIVSNDFEGKNLLTRHRMVNTALKEELKAAIHALGIKALTQKEFT